MTIKILETVDAVRRFKKQLDGKKLALVPTMGNLHDGHLSLVEKAKQQSDSVLVSIFVNPTQFGENEDLANYPRTFADDVKQLSAHQVEAVFFPAERVIYPHGQDNTLSIHLPKAMTNTLCGLSRPTHFQGVATVVAKLLQIVRPQVAVFGQKDFQQLAIIRRLVDELFMPVEIIGGDIIREPSGLAMSSRNQYLSEAEKQTAALLFSTLCDVRKQLLSGEPVEQTLKQATAYLNRQGFVVDYLALKDKQTLAAPSQLATAILLVAARLGQTRLIDNLILHP